MRYGIFKCLVQPIYRTVDIMRLSHAAFRNQRSKELHIKYTQAEIITRAIAKQ